VCCWTRREPRQAAKHDPLTYLTCLNLVISLGVSMLMLNIYLLHRYSYFHAMSSLDFVYPCPWHT
jgi:hypothetical protein